MIKMQIYKSNCINKNEAREKKKKKKYILLIII